MLDLIRVATMLYEAHPWASRAEIIGRLTPAYVLQHAPNVLGTDGRGQVIGYKDLGNGFFADLMLKNIQWLQAAHYLARMPDLKADFFAKRLRFIDLRIEWGERHELARRDPAAYIQKYVA